MKYDFKDLYEGPRFQNRARKRKIKLIITSIVAILGIVLLIGVINIFSGDSEKANVALEEPNETEQAEAVDDTDDEIAADDDAQSDEDVEIVSSEDNKATYNEKLSEKVTVNKPASDSTKTENSESNVVGSVGSTEESFEPVGTEQEGEHITDFTKGSQDWEEMTQAVGSATGLSNDNMIVWWMGNGGGSDKAISTVSTKDKGTYYRVQLQWVNGSGWQAIKVDEVEGNDQQPGTAKTDN